MKKCPQCNTLFEDALIYCTEDGATLIEENFVLPSESLAEEETVIHHEPIKIDIPSISVPPGQIPPPIIIEKQKNTGKYFLFLIAGLILGGVLTIGLVALILSRFGNSNVQKPNENVQISSGKHDERNKTRKDSEFNGFVLSENANIRSAPNSSVLESLPKDDRLNILERDGVWYRVVCEHSVSGWMHGNTIRFNADAPEF